MARRVNMPPPPNQMLPRVYHVSTRGRPLGQAKSLDHPPNVVLWFLEICHGPICDWGRITGNSDVTRLGKGCRQPGSARRFIDTCAFIAGNWHRRARDTREDASAGSNPY